jgi:hypothetical protein
MVQTTLAINAGLGLATALLYAYVARIIAARPTTTPDATKAKRAFVLWWGALAVTSGIGAAQQLLAAVGLVDIGVHATLAFFSLPPLMLALAGLLQYLVYIHTGSLRWHHWILAAHLALALVYFALVAWLRPLSVTASDWTVTMDYERESPGWLTPFALVTIIVPVLLASAAYFTLAFRTKDRLARFRIFTVSGAFLLWFGSSGLAGVVGWNDWYWWPLVARGIGLVSTLMILFAYRPGRRIEDRLRESDETASYGGPGGPGTLRLAFARRARRAAQRTVTTSVL